MLKRKPRISHLIWLATLGIALPSLAATSPDAKVPANEHKVAPKSGASTRIAAISQTRKIRHALNRLAFGPRPGDIERVQKIGLQSWIDEQLNPQNIDDGEVEARLATLPTLALSPADSLHFYEAERLFNRLMRRDINAQNANATMPGAAQNGAMPGETAPTEAAPNAASTRARRQQRRARRRNAMANGTINGAPQSAMNNAEIDASNGAMPDDVMPQAATQNDAPENTMPRASTRQRARRANAMRGGNRGMQNVQMIRVADLPAGAFAALPPAQQRLLQEAEARGVARRFSNQAIGELVSAKLLRAVESKRQLNEVMVDFWSNHFNLDVKKGLVRAYKTADERDAIRPHAWGKFRDLLGASAKSPAMLFYLDNHRSTALQPAASTRGGNRRRMTRRNAAQNANVTNINPANATNAADANPPAPPKIRTRMRGGVNENYARELMELHTLGVDGGYTQRDVQEVARCLTGWTINRQTGAFIFRARQHDNGEKIVLRQTIPAGGGQRDGERVLDILEKHPATAKHIARKLCTRLVSDQPSQALVQRVAQTFLKTDGDLREMVRSITASPEFFARENLDAKIKSPFEFAVSSVRALGGSVQLTENATPVRPRRLASGSESLRAQARFMTIGASSLNPNQTPRLKTLAGAVATMGQPLFSYQAPTGYAENSQTWVSAGALVSRLNFALDVTGGAVVDVKANPAELTRGLSGDNAKPAIDRLSAILLGDNLSASTRATLEKQFAPGTPPDAAKIAALLLGSPEFQRR